MKMDELKKILFKNNNKIIRFKLPTITFAPPHVHVTRVALIEENFIDCGGISHKEKIYRLQLWYSDDTEHRLTGEKLLLIISKSSHLIETPDLEVEIEHEFPFFSQFTIEDIEVEEETLTIKLGIKHTACLAEEICLPSNKCCIK